MMKNILIFLLVVGLIGCTTAADQSASSATPKALSQVSSELTGVPSEWDAYAFHDVHFHLYNYVQKGITTERLLELMGDQVGRVALFGIPLQQKWDHFVSGERAPTYYLHTDAALYYYPFVDAMIAHAYLELTAEQQQRFDPMITGFNPTDMYATDHIREVLKLYPGVFAGIGEFSVHKEFVSSKITGHTASLFNPSLDNILSFAGEVGLVSILHCDINAVRSPSEHEPVHLEDVKVLLKKHPEADIIWAHTGLGRFVKPTPNHVELLREMMLDPALSHLYFDISWDEVAKYVVENQETVTAWAELINQFPDRFLFGTDSVAPRDSDHYLGPYKVYAALWEQLSEEASYQVKKGNYERLFDKANNRVRTWEIEQGFLEPAK